MMGKRKGYKRFSVDVPVQMYKEINDKYKKMGYESKMEFGRDAIRQMLSGPVVKEVIKKVPVPVVKEVKVPVEKRVEVPKIQEVVREVRVPVPRKGGWLIPVASIGAILGVYVVMREKLMGVRS